MTRGRGRVVRDYRDPVHEIGLGVQGLVDGGELLVERNAAIERLERIGVSKALAIGIVLGHVAFSPEGNFGWLVAYNSKGSETARM
jgi:hypothetical protein